MREQAEQSNDDQIKRDDVVEEPRITRISTPAISEISGVSVSVEIVMSVCFHVNNSEEPPFRQGYGSTRDTAPPPQAITTKPPERSIARE